MISLVLSLSLSLMNLNLELLFLSSLQGYTCPAVRPEIHQVMSNGYDEMMSHYTNHSDIFIDIHGCTFILLFYYLVTFAIQIVDIVECNTSCPLPLSLSLRELLCAIK